MKLTFLGISAGENYPAVWCHCPNCEYARRTGGRNIRLNSCAALDDDVLLDMNANCFSAALRFGVDVTRTRTLLVTHEHQDHFYPQHLVWRGSPWENGKPVETADPITDITPHMAQMGGCFGPLPFLRIYGSPAVWSALIAHPRIPAEGMEERFHMSFTTVTPGQPFQAEGGLTVIPVLSRHGTPGCTYNYILKREGRTLLYALDTGGYDEAMWAVLQTQRFDCVVMEGTFGHHAVDFDFHMNKRKNLAMLDTFSRLGLWAGEPRLILSHMAPHWTPPYDAYAPEMAALGITVAYDGLSITI